MPRISRILLGVALALPLLTPTLRAQSAPADSGFRLRVGGDVEVAADEREAAIVVIRGDARVLGRVGAVAVIDGTVVIDGGRVDELVVVRGRAHLVNGAVVAGDAHLVSSTIAVDSGAVVSGRIERGIGRQSARKMGTAIALIGLGVLGALVLAGVLVALVVPEGLVATGRLIRTEIGRVAGAAALLWLAFPFVAVLLVPTLVGLPVGLGYFLFVMPILFVVGLIVSGTWIGDELLRRMRRAETAVSPVGAAAFGIVLLLLVGRIPLVGFLATLLVMLGAGAALAVATRTALAKRR
jgi:hypothetical protein